MIGSHIISLKICSAPKLAKNWGHCSCRLYGRLTATYESASTRRFRLGRVDCIRSATTAALQWATAMNQLQGTSVDPLHPNKRVTFSLITVSTIESRCHSYLNIFYTRPASPSVIILTNRNYNSGLALSFWTMHLHESFIIIPHPNADCRVILGGVLLTQLQSAWKVDCFECSVLCLINNF